MARKTATKKTAPTPRQPAKTLRFSFPCTPAQWVGFDADAIADHSDAVRTAPHLLKLALPPASSKQRSSDGTLKILCVMPEIEPSIKAVDDLSDIAAEAEPDQAEQRWRQYKLALQRQLQHRFADHAALCSGVTVDIVPTDVDIEDDGFHVAMPDSLPNRHVDAADYDLVFIDADYRTGKLSRAVADAVEHCAASTVYYLANVSTATGQTLPQTLSAMVSVVAAAIEQRRRQVVMEWAAPLPCVAAVGEDDAAVDAAVLKWARR